jgi:GR25 family glycosyltransferase involved in LPS biosynthesis
MSNHWDLFSVGHCFEDSDSLNSTLFYEDAYVPPGQQYEDKALGRERVILKSKGIVCTTGYAVSQTGAAKLLLKSITNLDEPVDLLIGDMIKNGELVAYHMYPPVMAQWKYVDDIGMDKSNSDINKADSEEGAKNGDQAWAEVERTRNVWTLWDNPDTNFVELALQAAGKRILGAELPKNK